MACRSILNRGLKDLCEILAGLYLHWNFKK